MQSADIRDLITLYGMITGQRMAVLDNTPRGVFLEQSGGILGQVGTPVNGTLYGYQSSLPSLSGPLQSFAQPSPPVVLQTVVQLDDKSTQQFLEGKVVKAIDNNPRSVQTASNKATASNYGRFSAGANLIDPLAARI